MAVISSRAQLFSMIALMLSLFFILLFSGLSRVPLNKEVAINQAEVSYLNDVILDLDSLVISSAETSSLKILDFSVNYLNGTNYFPSYEDFFNDCFIRGEFYDTYDTQWKLCSSTSENVSFVRLVEEVFRLTGEVYNLDINITHIEHNVSLFDAYSLAIGAEVDVQAKLRSQKKNVAWDREIIVSSQVDFNGIRDPASIGTVYERKIIHKPDERTFARINFKGSQLLVQEYINNTYYFVDQSGPSFFDRMEGTLTDSFNLGDSNPYGLATFIPAYHPVTGASLYIQNVSMVDHHYDWGATPQPDLLRFFNQSQGINPNVTIYATYALQGLGFDEEDLEYVEGNCDPSGCYYP